MILLLYSNIILLHRPGNRRLANFSANSNFRNVIGVFPLFLLPFFLRERRNKNCPFLFMDFQTLHCIGKSIKHNSTRSKLYCINKRLLTTQKFLCPAKNRFEASSSSSVQWYKNQPTTVASWSFIVCCIV